METPDLATQNQDNPSTPPAAAGSGRNIWSMPLESAIRAFLNNRQAVGQFLSLTGGSILYCLSALSIVYGITQMIGPPLAKSNALGDILPCVAVLNIYELALLAVLTLIVVWRSVTDDAISLVILVALFLVASGMTLGVVAPSGLDICLAIGAASVALGLAKLWVLRRYVRLPIGMLSAIGLTLILAWNFLGSSVMARPIMARTATDELRRSQWLLSWLVLAIGAGLIFVEAATRQRRPSDEGHTRTPFLHTHAMTWIFALVLLAAAGFHQYGVAYMFAVDYRYGDFIPLITVMSLLLIEFVRSLGKPREVLQVFIAAAPLGFAVLAVSNKMATMPTSIGVEAIVYPPVMLGCTGLALFWMSVRHRWRTFRYIAIVYALGILLTLTQDYALNTKLFGIGSVVVLLVLGAIQRNVSLCFVGVVALTIGLGTTDALARFARMHDLTVAGATLGFGGLGIIAVALAFGRRTPAAFVVVGTLSAIACVFDYLPKALHWTDIAVLLTIATLFAGLLWRTRDVAPSLILWVPVFPRAYLFATKMSSWSFVVLSFLLLFLGAITSLFLKRKLQPSSSSPAEQSRDNHRRPSEYRP